MKASAFMTFKRLGSAATAAVVPENRSIASLARPKYTGAPNHGYSRAMFYVAVETIVGDEMTTKFWTDRWLHGQTDEDLAPNLVALVHTKDIMQKAFTDRKCVMISEEHCRSRSPRCVTRPR